MHDSVEATTDAPAQFATESEFRRVAAQSLPRSIAYLSPGAQSALLAIAGNSVWTCEAGNTVVWNQFASPQNAGRLLWLREDSLNGIRIRMLGTQNGVFVTSKNGEWHLVSNGLAAIASEPLSISGSVCLLAMSNGGIYQSVDMGKTWQRETAMQNGEGQSACCPLLTTGYSSHQSRRAFLVFSSLHPQSASLTGVHSQNGTTRLVPANALFSASSVSEGPKLTLRKIPL